MAWCRNITANGIITADTMVAETELSEICKKFIDYDLHEEDKSRDLMIEFAQTVAGAFDKLVEAIKHNDENAAAEVITLKEQIRHGVDEILKNQASRITVESSKDLLLVRLELETLDHLRRIYTLSKRVAKEFIPDELAMKTE